VTEDDALAIVDRIVKEALAGLWLDRNVAMQWQSDLRGIGWALPVATEKTSNAIGLIDTLRRPQKARRQGGEDSVRDYLLATLASLRMLLTHARDVSGS
jgi:hypothetical protein